jgi:hypothetical protein
VLIAWRVFVVALLLGLVAWCGPRWLNRGIGFGDYGYAGSMLSIVWLAAALAARIGSYPDPIFSRAIVAVVAAVIIPVVCYHLYEATGYKHTVANLIFLTGVVIHAYSQVIMKKREETKRVTP